MMEELNKSQDQIKEDILDYYIKAFEHEQAAIEKE